MRRPSAPVVVNLAALSGLTGLIFVDVFGMAIRIRALDVRSLPDFAVFLVYSRETLRDLQAPVDWWFYPPPFVVLIDTLGRLGDAAASIVWLVLIFAAALTNLALLLHLLGLARHRWALALGVLGCGLAYYYVQWDLRAANVNSVALAALLGSIACARRQRFASAGVLLAGAIACKLYGALLLPYLAYRRQWRWLASACAWTLLWFVALPLLRLGPPDALQLTASWLQSLLDPGAMPDHYRSLHSTLQLLLPEAGPRAAQLALALQLAWVAGLGAYFIATRTRRCDGTAPRLEMCDIALLTLAPLPLSPAFQPAHGVVLWIASTSLVAASVETDRGAARRAIALAFAFAGFGVVEVLSEWPERGAAIMLAIGIYAASMAWLATTREPATSGGDTG